MHTQMHTYIYRYIYTGFSFSECKRAIAMGRPADMGDKFEEAAALAFYLLYTLPLTLHYTIYSLLHNDEPILYSMLYITFLSWAGLYANLCSAFNVLYVCYFTPRSPL